MSTDQTTRPGRTAASVAAPFDLTGFAEALTAGDVGYQLACYAVDAEVRITADCPAMDSPSPRPRVVAGRRAIAIWLHESARNHPSSEVSRLVDGGDRVAFTRDWRNPDGTMSLAISTAELLDGLITTQHTILVSQRDATAGLRD